MGNEVKPQWATGLGAQLATCLSYALTPEEGVVLLGDIAECRLEGRKALCEVLGLVARRQFMLWRHWRPWLALIAVITPIGIILSHVSRHWAQGAAVYLSAYIHDGDFGTLAIWSTASEGDPRSLVIWFCVNVLTLVVWSYGSGWVVGALSRQAIWTTAPLFYFALIFGSAASPSIARSSDAEIFSLFGYGAVFPAIQGAAFVIAPALGGMYQGVRAITPPLGVTITAGVAVALMASRTVVDVQVSTVSSWLALRPTQDGWLPLLLAVGVSWPIAWIAANACLRQLRGRRLGL